MNEKPFPSSVMAERALLGQCLTDPGIVPVAGELVAPESFYRDDHKRLFALLLSMVREGQEIDTITLPRAMVGAEDAYGGLAYVLTLPDSAPAVANWRHYAEVISEDHQSRIGLKHGQAFLSSVQAGTLPSEALLKLVAAVTAASGSARKTTSYAELADPVLDEIAARAETRAQGVDVHQSTGFHGIDRFMGGLITGSMTIIAARPSMGKTALAQCILNYAAMDGTPGLFISKEMKDKQLTERAIMQLGEADALRARDGYLARGEHGWDRVYNGHTAISELPVYIDDRASSTFAQVEASIRNHVVQHGVKVVVVDYIQLFGDLKGKDKRTSVGFYSRGFKLLAQTLDIAVIVLSQLSRKCEDRKDKRPMMADLREAGELEQDADNIIFIYRDSYYNGAMTQAMMPDFGGEKVELIFPKCRGGVTGTTHALWRSASVGFYPMPGGPNDQGY